MPIIVESTCLSDVFPERLKRARELRRLSQGEAASKSGMPPTSISHFEAGSRKPSFDNLRKLARALEVTTDYLLGLADTPDVSTSADPLYRHGQLMSAEDRQLAEGIFELLANKNRPKAG